MKFQIVRMCPHSECPVKHKEVCSLLPVTVRVSLPSAGVDSNGCDVDKYRVHRSDAMKIRTALNLSLTEKLFYTVCDHMGELIPSGLSNQHGPQAEGSAKP